VEVREDTASINRELFTIYFLNDDDVIRISEKYSVTERRVRSLYDKIEYARKNKLLHHIKGYNESQLPSKIVSYVIAFIVAMLIWWGIASVPDSRSDIEKAADRLCEVVKCV